MLYIVKCKDGRRWKVREAVSLKAALNEIASACVMGSIGSKRIQNDIGIGGKSYTIADVHQINSDGTERQAYAMAY